jgi:hypothetical protein
MNPVLGAARRLRTFLAQPTREADERADQRALVATARAEDILGVVTAVRSDIERSADETRRLFVALRSLIEEQHEQLDTLRTEVERLRTSAP